MLTDAIKQPSETTCDHSETTRFRVSHSLKRRYHRGFSRSETTETTETTKSHHTYRKYIFSFILKNIRPYKRCVQIVVTLVSYILKHSHINSYSCDHLKITTGLSGLKKTETGLYQSFQGLTRVVSPYLSGATPC